MSVPPPELALSANVLAPPAAKDEAGADCGWEAFQLLRLVFVAVPLVAGLDKLFHKLANWNQYLSPMIASAAARTGLSNHRFVLMVGAVEIALSFLVAVKPRIGAALIAAWLGAVIANLLLMRGFYDIALRDFGLCLGAIALARLSRKYAR